MKREDVLAKIETLLRQHNQDPSGSIHQDPYKNDLFQLFADAFNGGLLDPGNPGYLGAGALESVLGSRAPELLKHESWRNLRTFWNEWAYAWRHVKLLKLKS